jgi:PAS domain S-box-containing protein
LHTELALRLQTEAAVQVEHYKLETVTANLGAGLAIIDKEYHITWMNEAIHNMFGGKVGEFCYSSFHGETHACNGCGINDVFKGKTERSVHELMETSSGRTAWYEIIATPIKDRKGNITSMLDMVIPITERKLMEQRLQMSSKLASIGALASGIAHEINNPMTAVIGYAQLLMDNKDLPAEVKEDLEKINSQGRRVAKIIQNLLVFARKYKPEKMDVDINELIQGTLDLRRYELRTGNITVNTSLASGLPEIMVDRHQVQQVMLNLIVNAEYSIRTGKRNGIITIETRRKNGSIAISIADNGSGISPGNLARIFDPFFTTKDVGEGTGMGLAVSYGIVTEHNGIIYAESVEGEGSTFTVELPVKPSQALVAESAVETSKTTPVNTRKGKILIVEDEAAIQDIIVRILTIRGHQADTASSGNEALGRISESEYDLYLLDLKMPGMDGQDLFEILKQNKPLSALKVIFITGDTVTGDTQDFLESTGRPYVNKPFTPADLLAAVDKALG